MSLGVSKVAVGCCNNLYNTTVQSANWLSRNVKLAGVAAWEGAKKVASYISAFFTKLGVYLFQAMIHAQRAVVQGYHSAKNYIASHPREFKAAGIGIAIGIALTFILSRVFASKSAEVEVSAPTEVHHYHSVGEDAPLAHPVLTPVSAVSSAEAAPASYVAVKV